jgi:ATP-dependent exoDNAse (exonuclease V) beta subunit
MTDLRRGGLPVTSEQAAVVDQLIEAKVCVVSAGAGSGKTHTSVAAAFEILDRRLATIDKFVLITFTNKAANELRERLQGALATRLETPDSLEYSYWRKQQALFSATFIGTIHGFCARLLRTFGYEERVAREAKVSLATSRLFEALQDAIEEYAEGENAALLDPSATWRVHNFQSLIKEIFDDIRNKNILSERLLALTEGQPDDAGKACRVQMAQLLVRVHQLYAERKEADQALDSNDLLEKTVGLLRGQSGNHICNLLTNRYQYLFIDEFQDTDRLQKQIVDVLLPILNGLLVVGDKKQSIYAFRAADVSLLDSLAIENTGRAPLRLSISRRPTVELLATQNALFASMSDRYSELGDPLQPREGTIAGTGGPPPFTYVDAGSRAVTPDRIRATAEQLRQYFTQQIYDSDGGLRPVEPADIAILVRSNPLAEKYEIDLNEALRDTGFEVRRDSGGSFFQRPEIVSTYRMLKLLLRFPNDRVLTMALDTPYLQCVDSTFHEQYVLQYKPSRGNALSDWFRTNYPDLVRSLLDLGAHARVATVPVLIAELYDRFDIRAIYLRRGDRRAVDNLDKLRELAREMFTNEQALTLRQFVNSLQRSFLSEQEETEAGQEEVEERPPYIRIMTIHQSKGLEFPIVVLPEVQARLDRDDLDPEHLIVDGFGLDLNLSQYQLDTASTSYKTHLARIRQERLAEEMRVFYVAVTRAQQCVSFIGGGPWRANEPSDENYSWRDELTRAWPRIATHGAKRRRA